MILCAFGARLPRHEYFDGHDHGSMQAQNLDAVMRGVRYRAGIQQQVLCRTGPRLAR